jgi:hypothetical protein
MPVAIASTSLPSGQVAQPYSAALSATGGSGTFVWSVVAGSLPAGVSLNPSAGALTGTPISAGPSSFTIRAADAANASNYADAALSITIAPQPTSPVVITTTALPGGVRGSSYSASLAASGGIAPYTWSIVSGSLPAGLTLNAVTGTIAGTPTNVGNSSFTVRVVDSGAPSTSNTKALSIHIRKR